MKKRKIPARRRKRVMTFWILGLVLSSCLGIEAVNIARTEMKSDSQFGPYLGPYRFESVSKDMKQKVGDLLTVDLQNKQLTLKVVDDHHRYWLTQVALDDFQIDPGKIPVSFIRGPDGKVVKLVSKPNDRGLDFVLRKM